MKLIYKIKKEDTYVNVLEVLKCEFGISERLLHKLKRNNLIFLNNKSVFPNTSLKINDEISVIINFEEDNSNIVSTKMDLYIIYEDQGLLIINKPSGIPVHPSMDHYTDSLSNGIRYYFDTINLKRKIRPVNRLDKDTSGLVVFAKNEYIQECLVRQMKNHTFTKGYIAVCDGIFEEKQGTINAPIARKEDSIIERCIDENGDISITHYEILYENLESNYSVVKCLLETGRTHQIRVHMKYINHPLLGDTLYHTSSPLIPRQALHSYKISFTHPVLKTTQEYIAPLPKDIENLYKVKEK